MLRHPNSTTAQQHNKTTAQQNNRTKALRHNNTKRTIVNVNVLGRERNTETLPLSFYFFKLNKIKYQIVPGTKNQINFQLRVSTTKRYTLEYLNTLASHYQIFNYMYRVTRYRGALHYLFFSFFLCRIDCRHNHCFHFLFHWLQINLELRGQLFSYCFHTQCI